MRIIIGLFTLIVLASCNNSTTEGQKQDSIQTAITADTVVLAAVPDSIDIIYYKKPFSDPERYSRFFKTVRIKNETFLMNVEELLGLPGVRADSVRKCMSEGKILVPISREAYRVVYFSRSGSKECKYLYVIRDGAFYYYELPGQISKQLDQFEELASEPLAPATN